jgi:tripartite ATP-independent transporter DctP family solute receptor
MKTTKKLVRIALVLTATTFAIAANAQTILKLSHTDQTTGGRHAAAVFFAKKVEELTQRKYQVKVFCCAQLGSDPKGLEQTIAGSIDFILSGVITYSQFMPAYNVAMMPFLFENLEQGWKWYDESKWVKALEDTAPEKGFRIIGAIEAGFRNLTTKAPINGPDDAKGKKLRVAPAEMMVWTTEAMGFGAQVMPITEVYMAIQTGIVSGQENPIDTIYANKFYEVAPYITLTNHLYTPLSMAVSEKSWKKIPAADQAAIMRAAKETTAFSRDFIKKTEEKMLSDMATKGSKINRTPDYATFRKAVEPVYQKTREKYGNPDVETVLAETAAIRKAVK